MNGDSHVRKTLARLVGIGQDQALASTKNPSAREASSQCGLRLAMDRARRLHYLSRVFRCWVPGGIPGYGLRSTNFRSALSRDRLIPTSWSDFMVASHSARD
jgi:hypothetical protein